MIKKNFSNTIFLVICILITIEAICSFLNSFIDIFAIHEAISLWIIFTSSKSDNKLEGIKLLGGTIKGLYIFKWVIVGIIVSLGLAVMLLPSKLINHVLYYSCIDTYFSFPYISYIKNIANLAVVWIGLILLVSASIIATINILFTRKLYCLIYSINDSANNGTGHIRYSRTVSGWLMVLGILSAIGILNMFNNSYSALSSACLGAAMILSSIFLKDYISPISEAETDYKTNDWYSQN